MNPFELKGKQAHIFAFFESYLLVNEYINLFSPEERAFYEIIFGELPQKPHFDIDLEISEFESLYPQHNVHQVAENIKDLVILKSMEIIANIDIEHDILIYDSHSSSKYSYHIVINNKCHSNHKEAKAFYDAVINKISAETNGNYLKFIDGSVYSPRQQFRLVRCQKWGSNRPKHFNESFTVQGIEYHHKFIENVNNFQMKELAIYTNH